MSKNRYRLSLFLSLFFICVLPLFQPAWGLLHEVRAAEENVQAPVDPVASLWSKAEEAGKDQERAAKLYHLIYEKYPESPRAEEALWIASGLYATVAERTQKVGWQTVRDLYKEFVTHFPKSKHIEQAYLHVGTSYYRLGLYREALIYLNLFEERYPGSTLIPDVHYWRGLTLIGSQKFTEAKEVFSKLLEDEDVGHKIKGFMGLGDIWYAQKNYQKALEFYSRANETDATYYLKEPSILISLGKTHLLVGNVEQGRRHLFHYLNISDHALEKLAVMFELADSYYREGDDDSAQRLYDKIVMEGEPDDRVYILSKFRQAQYLDDPKKKLGKWQRRNDLTDPTGDQYYSEVLNRFPDLPQAQGARHGLFTRYMARDDFDQAYEVGRSYLKFDQGGMASDGLDGNVAGEIMFFLVKGLLERKEFEKVYDLYTTEHEHVDAYEKGDLRYLIGQALEALYLYDQAAIVYYRALRLPMNEEDKTRLYYRRAQVYIAQKDWPSAERLLTHLAKIYQGKKELGEIHFLTGKMREEQGKKAEALAFYTKASDSPAYPEVKDKYAEARLNLLLELQNINEAGQALQGYDNDKWLSGEQLQNWYSRLGDTWLWRNEAQKASVAYEAALGKDMPTEGKRVQSIHLHLGEALAKQGKYEEAADHFKAAEKGPDAFHKKRAEAMLRDVQLNRSLSEVRVVLEKY